MTPRLIDHSPLRNSSRTVPVANGAEVRWSCPGILKRYARDGADYYMRYG
jgi:hypothetical protein